MASFFVIFKQYRHFTPGDVLSMVAEKAAELHLDASALSNTTVQQIVDSAASELENQWECTGRDLVESSVEEYLSDLIRSE